MPLLETIGSSSARSFGLNSGGEPFLPQNLVSTNLIGYWDAGLALSAPTGGNGTTWRTLSSSGTSYGGSMGDVNIQGLNNHYSYGGSGLSAYVANTNNTQNSGSSAGMAVSLSGFRRTQGTLEYWLYPTAYNAGNGLFVNRPGDEPNDQNWFWFGAWDSGNGYYVRTGRAPASSDCCNYDLNTSSSQINNGPAFGWVNTVPLNTWKHVTVTWKHNAGSGNYTNIYLNGVLTYRVDNSVINANTQDSNPNGATTGRLLCGHNASNSQWQGRVGYIRAYNSDLSTADVLNNFNKSKMRYL